MKTLILFISFVFLFTQCKKEEVITDVDGYPSDVTIYSTAKLESFEVLSLSSLGNSNQTVIYSLKDLSNSSVYFSDDYTYSNQSSLPYNYDISYYNSTSISINSNPLTFKASIGGNNAGEVSIDLSKYNVTTGYIYERIITLEDNQNGMVVRLIFSFS